MQQISHKIICQNNHMQQVSYEVISWQNKIACNQSAIIVPKNKGTAKKKKKGSVRHNLKIESEPQSEPQKLVVTVLFFVQTSLVKMFEPTTSILRMNPFPQPPGRSMAVGWHYCNLSVIVIS